MGERLAGGNAAIALLVNSLATGAALFALIATLAPLSGAHLNPLITLSSAFQNELTWREALVDLPAQFAGAFAGTAVAHVMFGLPLFTASTRARDGLGPLVGEFVATFGLLLVARGAARTSTSTAAAAVACYITAAYWFTSSTSFANPAVTLARAFTGTFSGIRPVDVPGFLAAQALGGGAAILVGRVLFGENGERPRRSTS
jgi:glycerol uptake facilitator-like aquaporin